MTVQAYSSPTTVDEAVRLLADGERHPRVFAGGTDLLIQLRLGARTNEHLIDLKRIAELNALHADAGAGLRLGGAVSCTRLVEHAAAAVLYPGLVEAAALIGSTQIQNRATVAGNLCNGSPAADTTPALLALDAICVLAGPRGRREVPAAEIVTGPGRTVLADDELLVEIRAPAPAAREADAYQRMTPRSEMDIAIVGVAARVRLDGDGRCEEARIAMGAVGPRATCAPKAALSLIGSRIDEGKAAEAANLAAGDTQPISDKRGTAQYRREVTTVLTRRVILEAARRAGERA